MRSLCILVGFLLFCADAGAQSIGKGDDPWVYLALSPAKVLDPLHDGILYGVGLRTATGWAVEAGHVFIFQRNRRWWGRRSVDQGQRLHLGLYRYIAYSPGQKFEPFIGLRVDYLWADYTYTYGDGFWGFLSITPSEGNATVGLQDRVLVLNAIGGLSINVSDRVAFGGHLGLGARYRYSRFRDEGYSPPANQDPPFTGYIMRLNVPVDLRVLVSF
jgi:hypothetical protein